MSRNRIWQDYTNYTLDDDGVLQDISFNIPDNFNFAFDVMDRLAAETPDATALVWTNEQGAERLFSYADLKRYSDKAANYLRDIGIRRGDTVMLVLKRNYQFWYTMLALHKLGAIAVPATHLLTKKDFLYRISKAHVKAVICTSDGETADHLDSALRANSIDLIKVLANASREGWHDLDAGIDAADPVFVTEMPVNQNSDVMLLYFTSGTSGLPKMAAHDYTYPIAHIVTARFWQNVQSDGLHLTVADTGWGKAVWGKFYGQWFCETAVFVYDFDKFVPSEMLQILSDYQITTFCAPPTIFRFFIKEDLKAFDLSHLKYAATAGEALNAEVFTQFYEATGIKMMCAFGQTETTTTLINLVGMDPKPGSMGKPSPAYKICLLDDSGQPVDQGKVGEICIDTREQIPLGLFLEYYEDPEMTRERWHDGFYHTGDTAWFDADGCYWYEGRTDDLIKSSGYRIGPFEIESVLMEHPGVLECAVIGVPDEIRGQVVEAVIVLAKGYTPSDDLVKELQDHVKGTTAPYKYPRRIEFVTELPKTISGKIRRIELRQRAIDRMAKAEP
jgi:acetyl-CoA synthetase